MKLLDLHPTFLKIVASDTFKMIDDIKQADGLHFLCPVCFKANGGTRGTHSIVCWQPHVPQTFLPTPGRWSFHGSGYADLELRAGSSSIFLNKSECQAHFFIRDGEIQ